MTKLTRPARLPLAALMAGVAVLCSAAPAFAQLGDRDLKTGVRGNDVRDLQSLLSHLGYRTPATGFFGPMTAASVRSWEQAAGRSVDGVVTRPEVNRMRRGVAQRAQNIDNGNGTPGSSGGSAPVDPHATGPAVAPAAPPVAVPTSGYVFPIRGPHSYGTAVNRFGAPRSGHTHAGQDVLAASGTPLVAVRGGRVTARAFQGAAGNYVVIACDDGHDMVYMHLLAPAIVTPGQTVRAGQQLGNVGQTGDATAPHLHFEIWQGHWYGGGHPMDPLPFLRAWDGH